MARTDVRMHGLSFLLNRWPEVMHEVLYRFNQISGEGIRQEANCQNHVYIQYERDYIAQALMNATTQARQYLGYPPAPMWIEDEVVTVKSDLSWNQQTLSTKFDYVQAFGRRAATLIAPNVGVTYSRTRDTVPLDMATLDAVSGVTGIPADEIQVFFRVEDGAAAGGHECWQIEPLTVEVSGDNAAISGGRWLFVHPANVWATEYVQSDGVWPKFEGDVENEDLFITAVDVYRVYADPTNAVELILDPAQTTDSPVFSTADLVDADRGHYKLLTGSGQEDPTGAVRKASVSYKAGFPLTDGHMDAQFEQAIVRYANVLMPQAPEMCGRPAAMWQADQDMPEPSAQDAWYTPAFGLSVGGLHLAGVVEARQSKLKGKRVRPNRA